MKRTPAPIDPAGLEAVMAPSVANCRTLPAQAYVSQAVFDWERGCLFDGAWVCVGREPGESGIGAVRSGSDSIVIARDETGAVRGFQNVCRHRGHELMRPGDWRAGRMITCPYHAWSYGLDGTLKSAPRFGDVPGFSASNHPLIPVRLASWRGWLFVNSSGDAPPFADYLGGLDALVAPWEPGRLFVGASHSYTVRANWKTITENYHECHHCPSIHPQLSAVTDLESSGNLAQDGFWIGGPMALKNPARTLSFTGESKGVPMRGLDAGELRRVQYYGVIPNLLLSLHPDYVIAHRLEPLGPDETRVECSWLFPPEAKEVAGFDPGYAVEFWDATNRQDWLACESVARGLRSSGFRQGPLTWREDGVHAFMATIARAYREGALASPQAIPGRRDAPGAKKDKAR